MNAEEMTTEQALVSALTPKQLGDIELQPYSLMRQVIALDLCRGSNSSLFYAVVTVWVCTLSPIEALQAHQDVTQARLSAFEWAEALGYSILNYKPLLDAYVRLNQELEVSTQARIKGGQDGENPNAGGRPLV